MADPALVRSIGIHHIDLLAAATIAFKDDLPAIGRETATDIDTRRAGELHRRSAIDRNLVDIGIACNRHRIEDRLSIRRPARGEGRVLARGDQPLPPAVDIIDIDARIAVLIAQIQDRLVIGRKARGECSRLAIGDEAVVRAIRIHDRQPLDAFAFRPGLGDVGNAAVEKGQFASQLRIDRVRTFMRGAAPFARRHDEAKPGQFLPEIDVIEIAADGQIAIATNADKALDQLLDIAAFPIIILGRRDFLQRDRADASGALRLEQTRIAQVCRNHLSYLATQRGAIARWRVSWTGRDQSRHRDAADFGFNVNLYKFGFIRCDRRRNLGSNRRWQQRHRQQKHPCQN